MHPCAVIGKRQLWRELFSEQLCQTVRVSVTVRRVHLDSKVSHRLFVFTERITETRQHWQKLGTVKPMFVLLLLFRSQIC